MNMAEIDPDVSRLVDHWLQRCHGTTAISHDRLADGYLVLQTLALLPNIGNSVDASLLAAAATAVANATSAPGVWSQVLHILSSHGILAPDSTLLEQVADRQEAACVRLGLLLLQQDYEFIHQFPETLALVEDVLTPASENDGQVETRAAIASSPKPQTPSAPLVDAQSVLHEAERLGKPSPNPATDLEGALAVWANAVLARVGPYQVDERESVFFELDEEDRAEQFTAGLALVYFDDALNGASTSAVETIYSFLCAQLAPAGRTLPESLRVQVECCLPALCSVDAFRYGLQTFTRRQLLGLLSSLFSICASIAASSSPAQPSPAKVRIPRRRLRSVQQALSTASLAVEAPAVDNYDETSHADWEDDREEARALFNVQEMRSVDSLSPEPLVDSQVRRERFTVWDNPIGGSTLPEFEPQLDEANPVELSVASSRPGSALRPFSSEYPDEAIVAGTFFPNGELEESESADETDNNPDNAALGLHEFTTEHDSTFRPQPEDGPVDDHHNSWSNSDSIAASSCATPRREFLASHLEQTTSNLDDNFTREADTVPLTESPPQPAYAADHTLGASQPYNVPANSQMQPAEARQEALPVMQAVMGSRSKLPAMAAPKTTLFAPGDFPRVRTPWPKLYAQLHMVNGRPDTGDNDDEDRTVAPDTLVHQQEMLLNLFNDDIDDEISSDDEEQTAAPDYLAPEPETRFEPANDKQDDSSINGDEAEPENTAWSPKQPSMQTQSLKEVPKHTATFSNHVDRAQNNAEPSTWDVPTASSMSLSTLPAGSKWMSDGAAFPSDTVEMIHDESPAVIQDLAASTEALPPGYSWSPATNVISFRLSDQLDDHVPMPTLPEPRQPHGSKMDSAVELKDELAEEAVDQLETDADAQTPQLATMSYVVPLDEDSGFKPERHSARVRLLDEKRKQYMQSLNTKRQQSFTDGPAVAATPDSSSLEEKPLKETAVRAAALPPKPSVLPSLADSDATRAKRLGIKSSGNVPLIRNALHSMIRGSVNDALRKSVFDCVDNCRDYKNLVILLRDSKNLTFRGLYGVRQLDGVIQLEKLFTGPRVHGPAVITSGIVEAYFKYDSGAKSFRQLPTSSFSGAVHAVALAGRSLVGEARHFARS